MPGGFGSFWDSFSNNDSERSEGMESYVVFGDIPYEMQDFYYDMAMRSPEYEDFTAAEKEYMADQFMENFWYGGYGVTSYDQDEFLALFGLTDFDWEEYASLYDQFR